MPWGPFLRMVATIAVPVALQNLLNTTAGMVDTIMVAPLGERAVGALGLCAQFSSLMFSSYWGFFGGGMLFISQYWGSGEDDGIERSYGMTTVCMMSVGVLFSALAVFAPGTVMRLYTDKPAIAELGVRYLRIAGFAYLLQVFSMAMNCLLRATERVKIPMIASVVSVASNIFLNWVFIYGHLGFPAMGIRGAAVATLCAAAVNVGAILLLARRAGCRYLFHIRGQFRWTRPALAVFFRKCFPILCNEILAGIGNMAINVTLGRQPEDIIAAVAVFRTLEGIIIGFFAGFSSASSVLVGKSVGGGEPELAFLRARRIIYLCSGVIFAANLLLFAARRPILTGLSLRGDAYRAGETMLFIYGIASVFRMGNWIHNDTFRVAGDAVFGTVLEMAFMYAVMLPSVLLAAFVWHLPFPAIFALCYVDEPIRYVLMQARFYSRKWIKPVTDVGKAALEK